MSNFANITQNYNGRIRMPRNIGGSQNAGSLHQRAPNTGMHSLRPQNASGPLQRAPNAGIQSLRFQNTSNLSIEASNEVQQKYNDLVVGADLFTGTENVENPVPQDTKFSNILVSGVSFP
ncbi:4179_t:CDS:1 [Gigaspora margarita]|uniref:4179_t:CDS:1 n=1 Tax=Gigaspora margarita TaxID=4874 RepID=A0ABN7V8X7_GIGMA|nr:4179_t:CDS:1 [Gigaspora margarita]